MDEELFQQLSAAIEGLIQEVDAKAAFLVAKDGRMIAAGGDISNVDTVSLKMEPPNLKTLLEEREFSNIFPEGQHDNVYVHLIGTKTILIVLFVDGNSLDKIRNCARIFSDQWVSEFDQEAEEDQETSA